MLPARQPFLPLIYISYLPDNCYYYFLQTDLYTRLASPYSSLPEQYELSLGARTSLLWMTSILKRGMGKPGQETPSRSSVLYLYYN